MSASDLPLPVPARPAAQFAALAALWAALSCALAAAPLTTTTALQVQPQDSAPSIGYLKAGSEPAADAVQTGVPAGWLAVDVPGPFDAYVHNRDLNKALDVVIGTPLRQSPRDDAGVLEVFVKGDKADITGLYGSWTRVRLNKTLVAYIRTTVPVADLSAAGPAPLPTAAPAVQAPAPAAASPAAGEGLDASQTLPPPPPQASASVTVGPAPALVAASAAPADTGAASLPRTFDGTFESTRRPLLPRRPFDWQISGADGRRQAYLDLSRMVLTDRWDSYAHRLVEVYGRARLVGSGPEIVIEVESLHLK